MRTLVPLACNINRKGRWLRGVSGGVVMLAGLSLLLFGWPASGGLRWGLGLAAILGGAFQLFEAAVGWCAVRAMGFKTPI